MAATAVSRPAQFSRSECARSRCSRAAFEIDGSLAIAAASDSANAAGSLPRGGAKTTDPQSPANLTPSAVAPPLGSEAATLTRTEVAPKSATGSARRFSDLADFVTGSCNQLAFTASRQVCEAPGERLNPLYLFGGVGLGKTHLLEGIYCELRRRFPSWNIVFLTSEQFANYFTQALHTHVAEFSTTVSWRRCAAGR